MIWSSSLPGDIWWVWRSWLARQIVVLEIVGSSPITHPFFMQTYSLRAVNLMGYRQAVKAQHFDCCIVGSIPTSPVYGTLAQMVEHLTFNQVVGGSSPPCLTFSYFLFPFFCGGTILLRRRILRVSNEPCTSVKRTDASCLHVSRRNGSQMYTANAATAASLSAWLIAYTSHAHPYFMQLWRNWQTRQI